jgi:hypothetical protein
VVCVPTHALELVEYAAARRAIARNAIEARTPLRMSLDVLAQHCVTRALGGGFTAEDLLQEVRGSHAYAGLDAAPGRRCWISSSRAGRRWRTTRISSAWCGTTTACTACTSAASRCATGCRSAPSPATAAWRSSSCAGAGLGSVEENFVGRLHRGDCFRFAGRLLQLVRLEDMTAYVRMAKSGDGVVPKWMGGRMPLSTELGREVEAMFSGRFDDPELRAIAPLLALQGALSALPSPGTLLAETRSGRDGQHLFVYPFAGRQVHEGLAALLSLRWGRQRRNSFGFAVNDYGLALSPAQPQAIDAALLRELLSPENLIEDLRESLNLGELARRQFREIARVAGLLPPSLPGRAPRSMRQLQASSGLLFDVLQNSIPTTCCWPRPSARSTAASWRCPGCRRPCGNARDGNWRCSSCPAWGRCRFRCGPKACAASSAPRTGRPACSARRSSWRRNMRGSHAVRIAGEAVELLGDRALLWPSRSRLLIADLHLGKGDVFRRAGIGLPAGGTLHDLRRLTRLLEETGASELWILGDILHGAAPMAPWREQWARWRGRHPRVRVTGVAGNHDRALADAALEIELAAGCVEDGAFALRHEPLAAPAAARDLRAPASTGRAARHAPALAGVLAARAGHRAAGVLALHRRRGGRTRFGRTLGRVRGGRSDRAADAGPLRSTLSAAADACLRRARRHRLDEAGLQRERAEVAFLGAAEHAQHVSAPARHPSQREDAKSRSFARRSRSDWNSGVSQRLQKW